MYTLIKINIILIAAECKNAIKLIFILYADIFK